MNPERVEMLQKLRAADPGDPFAVYGLALEYLDAQPEEAIRLFQETLEVDAAYAPACHQLGLLYAARGERETARGWLERTLQIMREKRMFQEMGEVEEALEELDDGP